MAAGSARVRASCSSAATTRAPPSDVSTSMTCAEVERGYNVRRWTPMPAGGHFAAMEQPTLLAGDLTAFFTLR